MNAATARIEGLSDPLPDGERVLWQGSPRLRTLALRAFHTRKIAIYFAIMVAWRILASVRDGEAAATVALRAGSIATLGVLAVAILTGIAWLTVRSTTYAITDRRIVMRTGIVLSGVVNIPFSAIQGATIKEYRDGSGEIAISLCDPLRIGYALLWPHARPFRMARPEPTLRCIPDVLATGALLRSAVARTVPLGGHAAPAREPRPAGSRAAAPTSGAPVPILR